MSKKKAAPIEVKEQQKEKIAVEQESRNMLCDRLGFFAAEAYKMLRTNLAFTVPSDKTCRIIGVTSPDRGEGKSTTAINLSYTQAETGSKTLLIEADMRLPSVQKKLGIAGKPGLSNLLVGLCSLNEAVQVSDLIKNWHILPSGSIPPNPSELLGSEQMKKLLEECAEVYDMIILDLPPVNIVADALTIADQLDGLLLMVRENYTDRRSLNECMRKMSFLKEKKLLGFVVSDCADRDRDYRYRRYGRYGKWAKYGKHGKYKCNKNGYGGRQSSYEDVCLRQHQTGEPETEEAEKK